MYQILAIAFGGAAGSVLRFWMSTSVCAVLGQTFPYGTLAVNILGSFLAGFLPILILGHFSNLAGELRNLLLIGFLGGFTTFSAFSLETLNLLESSHPARGLLNIVLSFGLCLIAVWLGATLARQL